jgi:hypothetical protein
VKLCVSGWQWTTPVHARRDAARFELMVRRAAISRRIPVRADSVKISPNLTLVSAESAAAIMASYIKPTICRAVAQAEMLTLTCKSLVQEAPDLIAIDLLARYTPKYGSIAGPGGLVGFERVKDRRMVDTSHILCIGRDTAVFLAAVAERWKRDWAGRAVPPMIVEFVERFRTP